MIIVVDNTSLQISCILMTRPTLRKPGKIAQLVGVVLDVAVDAVADSKVTARSGATIRRMGIEIIMVMVSKRGEMIGCAIAVVSSVDGITLILMDFIPLGSVVLAIFLCLLTIIIGNCQGRRLVSQLALGSTRKADRELSPNSVWLFLKGYRVIRERLLMQHFLTSSMTSPMCWII